MGCFEEADELRAKYEKMLEDGEISPLFETSTKVGEGPKQQDNEDSHVTEKPVPPSSKQQTTSRTP